MEHQKESGELALAPGSAADVAIAVTKRSGSRSWEDLHAIVARQVEPWQTQGHPFVLTGRRTSK